MNKEISQKVFSQNVIGSFILVMKREPKDGDPQDRINDLLVSMYHFMIINEDPKITFLDMADEIDVGYGLHVSLYGGTNNRLFDEQDFWFFLNDLKKDRADLKKEGIICKKKVVDILTNNAKAIIYLKDNIYAKLANYKIKTLMGNEFPVYSVDCYGKDLEEIKLENNEEDVLGIDDLQLRFINWFKRYL